jgi:hypothetical protein
MSFTDLRDQLFGGERLLVRTIRLIVLDIECVSLRCEFEDACGPGGAQAFRALEVFVQQLALRGRRRLMLSVPADRRLTADEASLLDVFGYAQAEDYRALDERLMGMLGAAPPVSLGAAACLVAQAFAMAGLFLRAGLAARGQPCEASTTPVSTAAQWAAAPATT